MKSFSQFPMKNIRQKKNEKAKKEKKQQKKKTKAAVLCKNDIN